MHHFDTEATDCLRLLAHETDKNKGLKNNNKPGCGGQCSHHHADLQSIYVK